MCYPKGYGKDLGSRPQFFWEYHPLEKLLSTIDENVPVIRTTDKILISFLLSYTKYGKKFGSIKAKNNISTSPPPLPFTVQVIGDIGVISIQLHPAPTVENVLKIATKQQFEIGISVSIKQPVNYTFQFGDDSLPDPTIVLTDDGDTKVTNKYDKEGEYNITIKAHVSEYTEERVVHVTARPCGPPAIYFPNSYTEKDPQIITRGTEIDFLNIHVEKPTDCSQELVDPKYLWNISPPPVPAISDMERPSFELEPRRLDSGNYSVTVNISYNDTKITQNEERYWFITHLTVVSSQLVASITGGSYREIDSSSITQLELDASKSFDPDNRDENSKLNFDWMCKFEQNSVLADELCNSTVFVKLPDVGNQGIVMLNVSRFQENVTYVFKVTVSEGSRSASAEQSVKLLPNIPSLVIR